MSTPVRTSAVVAFSMLVVVSGCSTKKKLDTALDNANKLAVEYQKLAKNLNSAITDIRASATKATNAAPASLAKVPKLPAKVTGGVDVTTAKAGKTGTATADVNGDTSSEQVTSFVPDDGGDAAPAFASWQGSAASEDEGVCYLGWEKGSTVYIVASACDAEATGGYVCQIAGENATCSACNVEGECNACDLETEDFQCTWPGGPAPQAADQL